MNKKFFVLLATCAIAATSLHFTGCAAKAPKANLIPTTAPAIAAPLEVESLSKEAKNTEDVKLNAVVQKNNEEAENKAPDLPAESNPQAVKTAAKSAAKKTAKKTAKKASKKKTTKKKASKKAVKTAKKTTNDTNVRKARVAKHRQVIRENHGKRRDTLQRNKIIRDGGALVDWH